MVDSFPGIAEIQWGISLLPSPKQRDALDSQLAAILNIYAGALIAWDAETARTWGRLRHSPEVRRQPQALWDSLIDALAMRHGAVIATRNGADFRHAKTFDPWAG